MPLREARVAEEPVREVPEHAAEQQPQHERPQSRAHAGRGEEHDDARDHRHRDREDPGDLLAERERRPRVEHQDELQRLADHRDGDAGLELLQDEKLGELVGGQHRHREDRDDGAGRRRAKWGSAAQGAGLTDRSR